MDIREMEREKMRQDAAYQNAKEAYPSSLSQGPCSTANEAVQAVQPSLRERIRDQAARARRESRKADRLDELNFLLEKNPEVARILDLLEDAQRY